MSKKKKIIIIFFILIVFLFIIGLLTFNFLKKEIFLSPPITKNFCNDFDGDKSLIEQSKIASHLLYVQRDCNWSQINKLNSSNDLCAFSIIYDDYCRTNKILREKICVNNLQSTQEITCLNSCVNGKCM